MVNKPIIAVAALVVVLAAAGAYFLRQRAAPPTESAPASNAAPAAEPSIAHPLPAGAEATTTGKSVRFCGAWLRSTSLGAKTACAEKTEIREAVQADLGCPDVSQKVFSLCRDPKSRTSPALSRSHKGRFAIVTDVGSGMRWTLWRRVDERRFRCTAKSCGPVVQ